MTTPTALPLLAAMTLAIVPLARAAATEPAFDACAQAFVESFTKTYGPVTRMRIVRPAPRSIARDPVTGPYSDSVRYTFYATDPKTGKVLASAACTGKPSSGSVTLAALSVPRSQDKALMLSARDTK